jgi:isochorismate synthase
MLLTEIINTCFTNNLPFVSYRIPGTNDPILMTGGSFTSENIIPEGLKQQFVLAPFDTENNPIQYFNPENIVSGWEVDLPTDEKWRIPDFISPEVPVITDFESYQLQAEKLIGAMKLHEVEKIVLSRVLQYQLKEEFRGGNIFEIACKKYPDAFVYILNDGHGQVWMGATPETLIQVSSGKGSTMSLAGTQSIEYQLIENIHWGQKELKEHQFVTDYIQESLQKTSVENLIVGETISVQAGKMAHLKTNFSFKVPEKQSVLNIALALHPTPAVCGMPQQLSFRMINTTEKHTRNYYTGFLGIRDRNENCAFYVNLRCMQIIQDKAFIYVGGGLTEQSDPLQEWNETELKAGTMLSLFGE